MILSQISYLDCLVFLIFLAPQLIIHVGFFETAKWVLGASPSLCVQLPYQFLHERYFTPRQRRSPFVQNATAFQDFVIRCVRYAFAFMPAYIGRVFFSKQVALPFLYFRMLRHGYFTSPIRWREIHRKGFKGVWIIPNEHEKPDIVIYYCHGGGFSMGSSYFYLEFLLAWVTLLKESGYRNPALFTLEYTLVPDAVYPTQVQQCFAGYQHVLSIVEDPSKICVGGDSAGATLILSLLLYMADLPERCSKLPAMSIMISPWVTIISKQNRNTPSDYLNADSLHLYGTQYIGRKVSQDDPMVSPGLCKDLSRWSRASPKKGWLFLFGSEEVLGPETRNLISVLKKAGPEVEVDEAKGGIHAWPVATLYLGETRDSRLKGLRDIVRVVRRKIV
ncbi:Arylacetamide deacetylase-like protein [Rhizodiscina lignyota]|uniref:Arylacetamide deacetylase-like protein n=1 Tax=Rhizodiscina lignyota TaxID=1504668 RepID=A0A9P4M7J8_9PEZI|nr:Arylacetamide deacetylase-like protein [Rhizodiscina lignyota]